MENLIIERTKNMPEVILQTNGRLSFKGRILSEDATMFFEPIFKWIEELTCEEVIFTINIDYMNTSSSKLLFTVLRMLDDNEKIYNLKVMWYYEEDDEELLEMGEYYMESLLRATFKFNPVGENLQAA